MDHHQDKVTVFLTRLKTWKFCSIIVRHSPMEKSVTVASMAAANELVTRGRQFSALS